MTIYYDKTRSVAKRSLIGRQWRPPLLQLQLHASQNHVTQFHRCVYTVDSGTFAAGGDRLHPVKFTILLLTYYFKNDSIDNCS